MPFPRSIHVNEGDGPWGDVARQSELKGEIVELRGEIRAQLPKLYAANVASMIGVAGLVPAAAKLA